MNSNTIPTTIEGDVPVNFLAAIDRALSKLSKSRIRRNGARAPNLPVKTVSPELKTLKKTMAYKPRSLAWGREDSRLKSIRIKRELLDAGATVYGLLKSESRFLPRILHDNEHIEAVIYGQHQSSSAMMVATDERIIYLDKKPMVAMFDEVSYEVVSGIEFDIHTFFATMVLHTPVKNYQFKFVNLRCAERFARLIESQRLEREKSKGESRRVIDIPPDYNPEVPRVQIQTKNDMAGYYWLPLDEEEAEKLRSLVA